MVSLVGSAEAMRARYIELMEGMLSLFASVEEKVQLLDAKEKQWNEVLTKAAVDAEAASAKVDLNVGGRVFAASRQTLMKREGSYFHALVSVPGRWSPCADGAFFIDRDPELFERIIASMRSGRPVRFDGLCEQRAEALRNELDYYQLRCDALAPQTRWDARRCSDHLTLSDDDRTATKTKGSGFNAAIAVPIEVESYRVQIRTRGASGAIMVGYVKACDFDLAANNFQWNGWFINASDGALYSGFGDDCRRYCGALFEGDIVEVFFDMVACTVSFSVNGTNHGIAFTSVSDGGSILPCVELGNPGACVSIEL